MEEENELIARRRQKLKELREMNVNPFPNDVPTPAPLKRLIDKYSSYSDEDFKDIQDEYNVAGRIMTMRVMGKTTFAHIQDADSKMQIMLRFNDLGEEKYKFAKKFFDIGDIILVKGKPFKTKTGELTIWCNDARLITKSLRPLPEKWHGLKNVELRYRQRYVDLIVNSSVKEVFEKRSRIIREIRRFMDEKGFLEVETPMMQSIPGGATAKPFKTHHNALNIDLYLRIAPELYLKRLIVGGFEKVYEINRNFRNEGISTQHNPEFTMIEFYYAYVTYKELMDFTEELISDVAGKIKDDLKFSFNGNEIDLSPPWDRMTMFEAIEKIGRIERKDFETADSAYETAKRLGIQNIDKSMPLGKLITEIFEFAVEPKLIQPTFIYDFPVEVSPLSRRKESDPSLVDRFELFIGGFEIANAFSELNDPIDQYERFKEQVKNREAGDEEAHYMDLDYIRALEYGMPPTAGEGIGIDRLVMVLTGSSSIRDVILFPQMKPEN
ncbi:MAG: lysine--tRNA ligase [Candidatus Schekmanbacteria bacterium]|nr:MAG: lysine--tRNA ligase [Candidatus Schekmanbacteria bacterium]